MPAPSIAAVNSALKTRLQTISGLVVKDYQPDAIIQVPLSFMSLTQIEYHRAMGTGTRVLSYTISVIVGRVDTEIGQSELDDYASWSGSKSVRAALEADTTLGGVVDTLIVQNSASVTSLSNGDAQFLTVEFTVLVYA